MLPDAIFSDLQRGMIIASPTDHERQRVGLDADNDLNSNQLRDTTIYSTLTYSYSMPINNLEPRIDRRGSRKVCLL